MARTIDTDLFEEIAEERVRTLGSKVDIQAMQVVFNLVRLANKITTDLEATVHRPAGWSWPGFRLLFTVWIMGPLEPSQIAHLAGVSRAAISSVLNTLERNGLISRTRAANDGRAITVMLTTEGEQRVVRAFLAQNDKESNWTAELSSSEQETLIFLLRKLLRHHS
ncbi:MAG: MarR family winged helix-turn-helix transcriptional regulator [Actinobacteria bacterium]|jgi:DNA-binding MarR family transcriptional regulator|nr:MarR family winged helix-turn-helix transcriptional regulator [Actinomycetota bacterium]MCL6095455.1 MarR family winged helix-turn-helix transcriptional regulator [Actinomycetota bacterium]